MQMSYRLLFAGALVFLLSYRAMANTDYQSEPSEARVEQLLAPIALYPDTVLTHILIAATYPLEVIQADRWVRENNAFGGQASVDGVAHKDWDLSVKALVAFPELLARMSDDIDWLQDLGELFLSDEALVLATVQTLRDRAYTAGTFNNMPHLRAVREERVIYVEPAVERVVYLPYYDPHIAYGHWHWRHHPPVSWIIAGSRHHRHGISWSASYSLSSSFFFGAIAWPHHRVVLIDPVHRLNHYHGRHISRSKYAHRWAHNPYHRRHVGYRRHDAHMLFGDTRSQPHRDKKREYGQYRSGIMSHNLDNHRLNRSHDAIKSERHSAHRNPPDGAREHKQANTKRYGSNPNANSDHKLNRSEKDHPRLNRLDDQHQHHASKDAVKERLRTYSSGKPKDSKHYRQAEGHPRLDRQDKSTKTYKQDKQVTRTERGSPPKQRNDRNIRFERSTPKPNRNSSNAARFSRQHSEPRSRQDNHRFERQTRVVR